MNMPDVYKGSAHHLGHETLMSLVRLYHRRRGLSDRERFERTAQIISTLLTHSTDACFCMTWLMLRKLSPGVDDGIPNLDILYSDGSCERLDINEVPPAVQSLTWLIAAALRHDLDTAWAVWQLHFSGSLPGPASIVDGARIVSWIVGLYVARCHDPDMLRTARDCEGPPDK